MNRPRIRRALYSSCSSCTDGIHSCIFCARGENSASIGSDEEKSFLNGGENRYERRNRKNEGDAETKAAQRRQQYYLCFQTGGTEESLLPAGISFRDFSESSCTDSGLLRQRPGRCGSLRQAAGTYRHSFHRDHLSDLRPRKRAFFLLQPDESDALYGGTPCRLLPARDAEVAFPVPLPDGRSCRAEKGRGRGRGDFSSTSGSSVFWISGSCC